MVKAILSDNDVERDVDDGDGVMGDFFFLAISSGTYKALSDEASKRGMTLAQLVQNAFNSYLSKTESGSQTKRLLID